MDEFRRYVTEVEISFVSVHDMKAEEGIWHLDGLQRDLVQHYVASATSLAPPCVWRSGWLPGEAHTGLFLAVVS